MQETSGEMQGNQRILVVDDEFHVRTTIVTLLEKHGHCADRFENADAALAVFLERGADLVLTDVKMPGMDWSELLGRIRAVDPDIPVMLMTAYSDKNLTLNALKMGVYDFILKPFDPDYLLASVSKALKYRHLCRSEKDHKANLEKAVADKTRELQEIHGRLVLSEKMAAIGLLSAGVAHEINNPLSFVSSNLVSMDRHVRRLTEFVDRQTTLIASHCNTDVIEELEQFRRTRKIDYIVEDMHDIVAESLEGAERIKKIVASLKGFSRKDENILVEANLNDLIESTLTIVWNEIKYVATLNKELGDIPAIKCYPSQLSQVIMNLLVNAAHAFDKGPGTITIRTWADDASVYLEVRDTGCGIGPEHMDKIFTPFFTTKETGKGTGLGLSICYDIIARHNSFIKVESEVGQGSTFTVSLLRSLD